MSPLFYKFLHHVGLMMLFISLGGLGALALTGQATSKARGTFVALHGVGLIVILVAGFGLLAKLNYGFPVWVVVKLVLWLALGAIIVPLKRSPALARPLTVFAIPLIAAAGIITGVWHQYLFNS